MKKLLMISMAMIAPVCLMVEVSAAESETFTGTAARTGTFKRPLLIVDGKRYALQPSDNAAASVKTTLAGFSKGDTGTYTVKGTRGTVHRHEGIIVDSIERSAGGNISGKNAVPSTNPMPPAKPTKSDVAPLAAVAVGTQNKFKVYDNVQTGMLPAPISRPYDKSFRLAIPEGVTTVKGILVVANCAGGDSRNWFKGGTAYEVFCKLHDFAFIGTEGWGRGTENYLLFVKALAEFAKVSRHPELVHVPYLATGVSAGGGFSSALVTYCPEKVIAAVPECARLNLDVFKNKKYNAANPRPVPAAVLRVPVLDVPVDMGKPCPTPNLNAHRPSGALWSVTVTYGHGDEYCGQEMIAMPYLEAALKLRYPTTGDVRKGPLKLTRLDPESGWMADNATWRSGLTAITPAKQFKGDIKQSSWLLNQDLAYIYRAYATYDRPLKITSPAPQENIYTPVQAAGSSVTIRVDASKFPGWKKLEFYDGGKLLGTVTSGKTQFKATNLTPGFHTFSVLGTDAAGKVVTSDCAMVALRR